MDIGLNDIRKALNAHFEGISLSIQYHLCFYTFSYFDDFTVDFRMDSRGKAPTDNNYIRFFKLFDFVNHLHQFIRFDFWATRTEDGLAPCAHIIDDDVSTG